MTNGRIGVLGDVLFPPADDRRTTVSLLKWWESRRPLYNAVVGGTGLLTLAVVYGISFIPPMPRLQLGWEPLALAAVYGVIANVCYTFGWGLEAIAQRVWGDKCPRFGPALFRQGLAFSVGLTLLPVLLVSFTWVARSLMWLFLG